MPDKLLKRADVIASIRKEHPELGEFNDNQILNKVLERRPDLVDKIENPMAGDVASQQAQQHAKNASNWGINPDVWKEHPHIKAGVSGALSTLPTIGMLAGGAIATPETLGIGTPYGAAIGGGIGSGLQEIGKRVLGTDTTETSKGALGNIATNAALGGIGGAGITAATKYPITTALGTAGMLGYKYIPSGLRRIAEYSLLRGMIP